MIEIDDLIGKPYAPNATGPDRYDCWGLVTEVARRAGIDLPDVNRPVDVEQWDDLCDQYLGREFQVIGQPEPLAIVAMCFGDHWHAGIVLDDGSRFIHCVENHKVSAPRIDHPLWQPFIVGFYRYVGSRDLHS
mgnify:CR=1 FL=1